MSNDVTRKPSSGGHRVHSHSVLGKLFIPLGVCGAVAIVVAAAAVGAIGTARHPRSTSSLNSPTTSTVVRWRVPHGETGAPYVPVSGGATSGQGGFNAVSCPTLSNCVAVGADGSLQGVTSVSSDGGNTWTQGAMAAGEPALFAVDCPSSTHCVAVGQGAAIHSTDGGATWTSVSVNSANTTLLSVSCPSVTLCVSVGVSPGVGGPYAGQLLVSTNGGASWSSAVLPPSVGALGSVNCPSTTFCVAVGASIVVSTDGGVKWVVKGVEGGTGVLRSVSCVSETSCIAIGPNPAVAQNLESPAFVVTTSNGGETWTPVSMAASSATLDVISCALGSACEAAGSSFGSNGSLVFKSVDGGATWSPLSAPAADLTGISAVNCVSASTCVFTGTRGGAPVIVSSNGNEVATGDSVAPQVLSQKDMFR